MGQSRSSRPESTYRLQFHANFTFSDAAFITPYLAELGITHVYASPYLKARAGSTHGYDVVDPSTLNPELGSPADYVAWVDSLDAYGLSHILDIVPNHMGVATNDNPWWNDVLLNGMKSKYAAYFDIAWQDSRRLDLDGKVLLPVLGDQLGQIIKQNELQLIVDGECPFIAYYDRRFPVLPPVVGSLYEILAKQSYVLDDWRSAATDINYRRFFDITDLAALCMEREEVFLETHQLIFQLIHEGKIAGLRIDHPDGLYDPEQYLRQLQEQIPGTYVVVEKILSHEEKLPTSWHTNGTTGYDLLNQINRLFIDGTGLPLLTQMYHEFISDRTSYADVAYQCKRLVLDRSFPGDLERLARSAHALIPQQQFELLHDCLREIIACFPIYRTYIRNGDVTDTDQQYLEIAFQQAKARVPTISQPALDAILSILHSDQSGHQRFIAKLQQLTAPVTAKGIEDTAFYRYNRLVSLNEVGGDPDHFDIPVTGLHNVLQDRKGLWPHALSPLSTHDTKRSEDVRARINVLSEVPNKWACHVRRWHDLNACHRRDADSPSANDEYLLYQTLLGAWPLDAKNADEAFCERISAYMIKAVREAKMRTSWTDPNSDYENALLQFIQKVLDAAENHDFISDFLPFQRYVARVGLLNSLSQTLLRLTVPGAPDTYQGTELWDFSLVDPDNRRPVDYRARHKMLSHLLEQSAQTDKRNALIEDLLKNPHDGRSKLFITSLALRARRDNSGLFSAGDYLPILAKGPLADHIFAFARRHNSKWAFVIVPRLMADSIDNVHTFPIGKELWRGNTIELPVEFKSEFLLNLFTQEKLRFNPQLSLCEILGRFPIALLASGS